MTMKQLYTFFALLMLTVLTACGPVPASSKGKVVTIDTVFTWSVTHAHGQYYKKLDCNVFELDFYSRGLSFDTAHVLTGSGSYLYLSDAFLSLDDSLLRVGTYTIDTVAKPFTLLPGKEFEGHYTGTCLAVIQDGLASRIYRFTAGNCEIYSVGDSAEMEIHFITPDNQTFDAVFHGTLAPQ